eukprot:COSAG01_NODE_9643_length_2381_cov_140.677914_3_plen_133_part_00
MDTPATRLLDPSALPKFLAHANSGGVKAALLCNRDGAVLSFVGDRQGHKFAAAIAANMWTCYEANALGAVGANELGCLLLDCEEGQLAVVQVSSALLLGMVADCTVPLGLLKAKITALQQQMLAEEIDTLFQ